MAKQIKLLYTSSQDELEISQVDNDEEQWLWSWLTSGWNIGNNLDIPREQTNSLGELPATLGNNAETSLTNSVGASPVTSGNNAETSLTNSVGEKSITSEVNQKITRERTNSLGRPESNKNQKWGKQSKKQSQSKHKKFSQGK